MFAHAHHTAMLRLKPQARKNSRASGFTLLEMSVSVAIFTIVMGMLFTLSKGLGDTSRVQMTNVNMADEARRAMIFIDRELRQAQQSSVSTLPSASASYCVAADVDGNGTAVDSTGGLETSTTRRICRDTDDLNHDGIRTSQLVAVNGTQVTILANYLYMNEDYNGNKVLDTGEDWNKNGVLDPGLWFARVGNAIRVTIQTVGKGPQGQSMIYTLQEDVFPRN